MDWETFFRNYRRPDFVPGFTILNKLGSGVFGEVYKAKRTSIGKLYAIKFLRLQDERLHEQVVRELDSVDHFAQVDHPNLVSIEDRGEVCGIPYIIMGYAGDETLKTRLEGGALDAAAASAIFRQMLRGVAALHEHSIIHFDLKPANIFLKGDVARVGDYGLSKLMTESRATLSMGRGTPYYMAPEMLQRRGDARSDVYSLGVIFYEMFTGEVPFKGETEWEILKRHETEAPNIPTTVPRNLCAFLKQCLGKDPESRFVNAGAMLNAFEAASSGAAVPAALPAAIPPPPPIRTPGEPSPSVRAGEVMGSLAAKGRVTIDKVRKELGEVLHRVREETSGAWTAARSSFEEETAEQERASAARRAADLNSDDPVLRRIAHRTAHREARAARRVARREARQIRRESRMARKLERAQARVDAIPPASEVPEAPQRRRRGLIGASFAGLGQLLMLPFALLGWIFRNAVQLVVVAAIVGALCFGLHLGLEAAIL